MSVIGRSVRRLEDRPLVTGRGAFAADIAFPQMLHMGVVRSGHAHGRIMSIDASGRWRGAGGIRGRLLDRAGGGGKVLWRSRGSVS